jgi:superkiller protein 3
VNRVALIILALALAACQPAPAAPAPTATYSPQATSAAGLVAEGDERLALSDFAGAERAYAQAIEADASFAPAHSHRADAHLFNPDTRESALAEAQTAVDLAPESAEAWAYLARARDWNGQFEEARAAGERAVELDPQNADAQSFLGEVYADLRLYDEALQAAERAVELDPNNAEARRNLGYLRNAMSRYDEALAEWQAAHDLQPQFVHRHTSIATYYLFLRPNPALARQWLADAQALAPDDTTTLLFVSRLEADAGNFEAAHAACERVLALAPAAPDGHNCQANVYAAAGDWSAAEAERLQAIAADPEDETGFTGLGYVYFATGNCREAVAQFERAISLNPRSGANYSGLGLAQLCAGQEDEAVASYETAIELEPFNGDHHVGLGRIYLQQGRFNQAEREMQAALEIDPQSDQFTAWLGRVYAEQGDLGKAIEQYEAAAALNPADGGHAATLGFAHLQNGAFEAAEAAFQQALAAYEAQGGAPNAVGEARYGLGLTYIALEDCASAVPPLQAALQINPNLADAQQYLAACRRSAGLTDTPLPPSVTASSVLSADGALAVLNEALPALGVQGVARYEQISGVTVLTVLYAASGPPSDPAFVLEQSPVVYAGAWALARLTVPLDNLLVAALGPDGNTLGTVHVRREYALWWTQGLIGDDEFAALWNVGR